MQHHDPLYISPPVQQNATFGLEPKAETSNAEIQNANTARKLRRRNGYTPVALTTPALLAFCVLTLAVFILLQIAAAGYFNTPDFHALARRSADSAPSPSCSPGATCAPAKGSWTNSNASPSSSATFPPSNMPQPGAPKDGSWSIIIAGWRPAYYFVGAYVPTLTAILFSIWWKCIFTRIKEMEPYYQMGQPGGAKAGDSILLAYSRMTLPKVLLSSVLSRHWLSFLSSVNMVLVTICTIFASETLFIASTGDTCGVIVDPTSATNEGCRMYLTMRPPVAWAIGGILFYILILTLVIVTRLRSQVSGIMAEATSIVGVASLLGNKATKGTPQRVPLASLRYSIASSELNGTNLIIETGPLLPQHFPHPPLAITIPERGRKSTSPWSMHPIALVAFWVYLAFVIVLILYYRFVSKPGTNDRIEDFLDSQSFGVRLFMTILGLIVKLYWASVEEYIRRASPYTALASEHGATAAQSVLVRTPSHAVTALFHRATWRNVLLGIVTLMSVLTEVLVITMNAIPFSTATAYLAFQLSAGISLGILFAMFLTVPAVFVWKVGFLYRVDIPDVPECIADVFELMANPAGWNSLGLMKRKERDKTVRGWHARFGLRRVPEGASIHSNWRIMALSSAESSTP